MRKKYRFNKIKSIVLWLLGLFFAWCLWLLLAFLYNDSFLFPTPNQVFLLFQNQVFLSSTILPFTSTLFKLVYVLIITICSSIILSIVLSINKTIFSLIEFSLDFFRSLPATVLFPLFMLWFGINDTTIILTCSFSSTLILTFTLTNTIQNLPKETIFQLKSQGANYLEILKHYIWWQTFNTLITNLRVIINLSLVVILVLEMFSGSKSGIGSQIIDSKTYFEIDKLFFWILITGTIGYSVNKLLQNFR